MDTKGITKEQLIALLLAQLDPSGSTAYLAPGDKRYKPVNVAASYTNPPQFGDIPRSAAPSGFGTSQSSSSFDPMAGATAAAGAIKPKSLKGLLEKIKENTGPGVTFRDNLLGSNYIRGSSVPQNPNIGLPNNAFGIEDNIEEIARNLMRKKFSGNLFGL